MPANPARLPCLSEPGKEGPPFTAYWKAAVTNCVGPACGLQALKYISYPAQVGCLGRVDVAPLRWRWLQCGAWLLSRLLLPWHMACPSPSRLHLHTSTAPQRPPAHLCAPHALTLAFSRQVLAKSSKMIPVMLMGTVLHGKRYSLLEYACCLAISGGRSSLCCGRRVPIPRADCGSLRASLLRLVSRQLRRCSLGMQLAALRILPPCLPAREVAPSAFAPHPAAGVGLFGMKSSSKVTRKLASPNAPLGYGLCLVNLVLDGYTNAAQVRGGGAAGA